MPNSIFVHGAADLVRAIETVDEKIADVRFRHTTASVAGHRLAVAVGF